jgi:hypothetical protein
VHEELNVELNDELLCAYLDDEVSAAIAADAGAKLRLARMTGADHRLQNALPLPGADHFQAAMAARIQNNIPIPKRARVVLPWAAVAAISGVLVGHFAVRPAHIPASQFDIAGLTPHAQQILQSARSGVDAGNLRVVLTFKDDSSRYCRVFHARLPRSSGEGLACRDANGWNLLAWDAATGSEEAYRTAGSSAAIDAAMNKLGGSPALDAATEAAMINGDWK